MRRFYNLREVVGAVACDRAYQRLVLRTYGRRKQASSDYDFLLERYIVRATLHRAESLAQKWGVLPHVVMIANGWLSEADYYRALAHACGVPFRA